MRKMAKLNVAIADDNERILTMLDEVLTADDDITVGYREGCRKESTA